MIPLADNPAVTNPRAALTPAERDALCAVAFFKRQARFGRIVQVGNKRFAKTTIEQLKRKDMLRGTVPQLTPTIAGQLAIDKLKGERP